MISDVTKILIICLITAFLSLLLRQKSAEYAFGITILASVIIIAWVLKSVTNPIREISEKLDFSSPENLSRFFKKSFGYSPSEYKKRFKSYFV